MKTLMYLVLPSSAGFVWLLIITALLRVFGIRLPIRFGKDREKGYQSALRPLGKLTYLCIEVLRFGGALFVAFSTMDYLDWRFTGDISVPGIVVGAIACLIISVGTGLGSWKRWHEAEFRRTPEEPSTP